MGSWLNSEIREIRFPYVYAAYHNYFAIYCIPWDYHHTLSKYPEVIKSIKIRQIHYIIFVKQYFLKNYGPDLIRDSSGYNDSLWKACSCVSRSQNCLMSYGHSFSVNLYNFNLNGEIKCVVLITFCLFPLTV